MKISETELILKPDRSVYHLNLQRHHLSDRVIAVGDPGRVPQVSKHFDKIEFKISHREFVTHTGVYHGKPISVVSTGIGTDNVEIFMMEIDALVNVNLRTREPRLKKKSLNIVRIGTSGALQDDIPLGSFVVSASGVGLDNLMNFYPYRMKPQQAALMRSLRSKAGLNFVPYMADASEALYRKLGFDMVSGNTVTSPGFYAPQGRSVRIPIRYKNLLSDLSRFQKGTFRLTNFEMETSAYYALGKLMGHSMLSLNLIIAQRNQHKFLTNHQEAMDELIVRVLDRI
ncbi:MAG: nucleoside phosphorylase, partial [Cyclobacteriaceae bacterium]|nr:nucleoside phosphorylase [Cyclobacteriaceae bacterium]